MTVRFYCSANEAIAPQYNDAARSIVRAAAARGYHIVSGGTTKGTMRVVCEEALKCGAYTKGVLPRFMAPMVYPDLSEVVWTDTMNERKEAILDGVDLVVALPGGIGTMDELFGTMVLIKLGKFHGRIAALNIDGFYDPLKALLDHFVATGMLAPEDRDTLKLPATVQEMEELL